MMRHQTVDVALAAHDLLVVAVVIACAHLGLLNRAGVSSSVELLRTSNSDNSLHSNGGCVCEVCSLVK